VHNSRNVGGRWDSQRRLVLGVGVGLLLLALGFVGIRFRTASGRQFPGSASADPLAPLPRVMLWAWERHEDLRTIDPRAVGVAYLAKRLVLRQDTVVTRPRLQSLQVPPATVLIPVIRLEVDKFPPPTLAAGQRMRVVAEIAAMSRASTIPAVQVDFDAKTSERAFYRAVLHDLRQELPDTIRISITALASWCLADNWLAGLPIDEAVPMLFRMGADRQRVLFHLQTGGDVRCLPIQQSLGMATDEPLPRMPSGRRMYVFSPRAWSPVSVRTVLEEVKQWE
jgi:hypothetical protein